MRRPGLQKSHGRPRRSHNKFRTRLAVHHRELAKIIPRVHKIEAHAATVHGKIESLKAAIDQKAQFLRGVVFGQNHGPAGERTEGHLCRQRLQGVARQRMQ